MKKTLILSSLLLSSLIYAKEINKIQIEEPKQYTQKGELKKTFSQSNYALNIKTKLNELWGIPKNAKGEAKVKLIMDTNAGQVMSFFVTDIKGDKEFKEHLKRYIKKIKKVKFKKHESKEPFIEIRIGFETDTKIKIPDNKKFLIYENKKNVYKNYITYLIKNKGIKKETIKKHLKSKKNTFIKSMLFALYYDYEQKNVEKANKYYEILLKRYPEKLKEQKEGLFISEWLLKKENYPMILKIFPDRSCQFFKKPEKQECYYFRGIAKYKQGLDYDLELNIAKNYFKQAENIMKKGGK